MVVLARSRWLIVSPEHLDWCDILEKVLILLQSIWLNTGFFLYSMARGSVDRNIVVRVDSCW